MKPPVKRKHAVDQEKYVKVEEHADGSKSHVFDLQGLQEGKDPRLYFNLGSGLAYKTEGDGPFVPYRHK